MSFAVLALGLGSRAFGADAPSPKDWDLEIRVDKTEYAVGDVVNSFAGMAARAGGTQGWSYGVKHDPAILSLKSVTTAGTDVPSVFNGGFNQTTSITSADTKIGYIQAIVLSFVSPAEVPISDFFRMAVADYDVLSGVCEGKSGDVTTKVEYTDTLAVPKSPPVDINITVTGVSVIPEKILNVDVKVKCEDEPPVGGLAFVFDKSDTDLVADQTSLYDVKVLVANGAETGSAALQGWSYGVQIDTAELVATLGEPGADAALLKSGNGPDFKSYDLDEQNTAGTVKGITVGVVIDLSAPGQNVLAVSAGARKHMDTIKVRSKNKIAAGGASKVTTIRFSDSLGGDRPVEVLAVISGDGIVPDFTDTLDLTLLASGTVEKPKFIRGDANDDARLDIADGIWIINHLFYGGDATACAAAADANADGTENVTDAMYIFQYQLQPGATPGSLFAAPPAPFPSCGSVDNVTVAECPMGSTSCMR